MSTYTQNRSPRGRGVHPAGAGSAAVPAPAARKPLRLPDAERASESRWTWRAMLFLSLIALGLCLRFAVGHDLFGAVAWAVITVAWFTFSMLLWRRHLRADDRERGALR